VRRRVREGSRGGFRARWVRRGRRTRLLGRHVRRDEGDGGDGGMCSVREDVMIDAASVIISKILQH